MKHRMWRQFSGWLIAAALALPSAAVADDPGVLPGGDEVPQPAEMQQPAAAPQDGEASQAVEVEQAAERAAARVSDQPTQRDVYTLDGMVGQVNGRPIYARTVFEAVEDRLVALGRQNSRAAFRREAARLIAAQLDQIVTDALVLGAAERDLSEQERMGLRYMLHERREELLRQHGRGSLALTESTLRRETGKGLDATLRDFRQEVLIQRYLRRQLLPKINVTRRDIRRYYNDNHDEFNPQAQRTLELIRVDDADQAASIAKQLEAGHAFADATDEVRRLDAPGEAPLAYAALNDALAELAEGEYAGPIEAGDAHWFIRLAEIEQAEARSLREVQLEIEDHLRNRQFRRLSEQYRRELFLQGSYNPIDEMTESLLEIAMSRYAPQDVN